ncbi:MAG: heme ABC transporter ATP-binding protein [Chloroflexi bacterium HGW-Chloroflexi-4]|jgi:simple sugar transport system ATP-binding protein|nr:MAG: heme ABC transporter ATP-binding protein [Chloroflexi bacterium HGW-Chloroflexi-4]
MHAVEMKGIVKRFADLVASDHVDFNLEKGEIHALLGENGAGKTTLMRILYGLYTADEGQIIINEKPVVIHSPKDAIKNGIGMVTQHFTLVPTLTVAENMVLGETAGITLNLPALEKKVAEASEKFGIPVKPQALIKHLSVGERQRVEILKALYHDANVLILDEPTAVLVPQEVDMLFEALTRLQKSGLSVIFISHHLNEVMQICQKVTVLRDGKLAGTVNVADTNLKELANMMVGRENFGVKRQGQRERGNLELKIENICASDKKGLPALKDVSLDVHQGEILGLAGVSGNGQTELSAVLCGMHKITSGKIFAGDVDLSHATTSDVCAAGVGRIPEDRHANMVGELSVAENLILDQMNNFVKNGIMDYAKIQKNAEELIKSFNIKASAGDRVRTLSGGNMQKVMLARTLSQNPRIVIASQPTRGLDVGATDYVRTVLLEQRDRGAAVLLLSEDLEEIMALSDRIAVIYGGRIMGILPAHEATAEKLGLMMAGSAA